MGETEYLIGEEFEIVMGRRTLEIGRYGNRVHIDLMIYHTDSGLMGGGEIAISLEQAKDLRDWLTSVLPATPTE